MEQTNLQVFEKECRKWIKYFGLLDWDILYLEDKLEGARAIYTLNLVGRVATLTVDNEPMSDVQVKRSAFHEVCHLLISELAYFTSKVTDDSEEIQHVFIRRMENSIFEADFQKTITDKEG